MELVHIQLCCWIVQICLISTVLQGRQWPITQGQELDKNVPKMINYIFDKLKLVNFLYARKK